MPQHDPLRRITTPDVRPSSVRMLRKLREERFLAPLTVERFDSPVPAVPKVSQMFEGGLVSATIPVLGFSIANLLDEPLSAAEGTVNSLLQALGIGETEEIVRGITVAGSKTRDITDPSISLEVFRSAGLDISEDEIRARNFKRFLVAGGLALVNAGRGGLERGYEEGQLAAPENDRERVADFAGQLLADMGITLPFIGPTALLSRTAVTALGKTAVGRGASRVAGAAVGGREALPVVQAGARAGKPVFPFPGFSGATGQLTRGLRPLREVVSDKYGTDVAAKVIERTTELLTNLGVDVGIGMGLGGLHVANALANGEDLSPEEIVSRVALYAAFGLGIGTVVQGFHAVGLSRSLPRLQNTILSGPFEKLPIGTVVGSKVLVGKAPPAKGGLQGPAWRVAEGENKGSFTKAPSAEELAEHILSKTKAIQEAGSTPPQIEDVSPAPLGLDQRVQEVQTLAAAWLPTVKARASQVSPAVLRGEMVTLARQALDPGIPVELRVSMQGKARAIQEVLGEAEPQAGVVSLQTEQAAVQIVMNTSVEAATRSAAEAAARGNRTLHGRILALLEQDLPKLREDAVSLIVSQGEATTNRGLVKENLVRSQDGKNYRLLEEPSLGVAVAHEILPAGTKVQTGQQFGPARPLPLHDVVLRPDAGVTALLTDGRVLDILEVIRRDVRTIRGRTPRGEEATVPFSEIVELGNDVRSAASHKRLMEIERGPNVKGATAVEPAIVATPEGEVGTLVAQGPEGNVVRMRDGSERVVERVVKTKETADVPPASTIERRLIEGEGPGGVERRGLRNLEEASQERFRQIVRSRQEARAAAQETREVLAFVPGTRPEADAHILFAAIPEERVTAFEAAYTNGRPLDSFLTGGVHVLPPVEQGFGTVLYGIELPQSVLPNTAYKGGARRARDAIAGKAVKLETYESRVILDPAEVGRAQIYRVPEGLRAKTMRSEAELVRLRGAERATYLGRLLDFSDDVTSEVAQATTKRRVAGEKKIKAQQENDGPGVVAARVESGAAIVEATNALTKQAVDSGERMLQGVLDKVVEASPAMNETVRLALAGDRKILQAFVTEHLAAGEEALLLHNKFPGKVLVLRVEGDNVAGYIREAGVEQLYHLSGSVDEALASAGRFGFSGGLHTRTTPGTHVMDGNPWVRAVVDDQGAVRIYQGERLVGSDEVVWQLVGSKGVGEAGLEELGFVQKAVHSDVPPPWEVGPITEGAQPLYGGKIGRTYRPQGNEVIRDAQASLARQAELQEWAPVAAELASTGLTEVPGTSGVWGNYTPKGQPVRITSAPLDKPTVTVEFADGSIAEVARSEIRLSKVNSPDSRNFLVAQDAFNGGAAYDNVLVAKLGLGALEKELGLFGTNRPSLVRERGLARAQEHIDGLSIKDGEMLGDPATVDKLVALHDRAVDLGFGKDVLGLLPADSREMFVEAAYQHARRQITDEPYSLLFAGAKYDKLAPKQGETLRQIAREHNLSSNLPLHRVAEDLWNRRLIDPMSAQWTLDYRQELGMVRTAVETNLDSDAVTLVRRPARGRTWWASRGFNPSHYELAKHPVMQAFESAVRHAMEVGQQSLRDLESFGLRWQRQQKLDFDGVLRKVKQEDWFLVRDLIENHGTWDNAVEARAIKANDPRHLLFSELVERLERSKNRHIRLQLKLGTEPLRFSELSTAAQEEFLASHSWVADSIEELLVKDYLIIPGQLQKFKSDGLNVRRGVRTDEEIEEFMALLLRHDSSEQLPVGIGGERQWMREQFDLWKRFGRENYWPRIHEGEFALQVEGAAGWQNVGFATTFQDATLLYRQLRQQGEFGPSPFQVVHKKAYADDILQETLTSQELFTWVNSLKDALVADEETLAGLFVPFAGKRPPSPVLRKPVTGSLAERASDLRPPVRHPWQELQIYERRLARQEQRFATAQAYKTFLDKGSRSARDLDAALAGAEGLQPLFSEANTQMYKYATDFAEDAIGLPTVIDKATNHVYAYLQMALHGPRILGRAKWDQWTKGEVMLNWREILDASKWQTYGAAKQRASEIVGFQAQWRMAMGPATALVNGTQYHLFTTPMLKREFGLEASWAARGSWFDAVKLWVAQTRGKPLTGEMALFNRIAEEVGVNLQIGRHLAGSTTIGGAVESSMALPVTTGLTKLGTAQAWTDFLGMYMFNGAERVNRLATALASYKSATHPKARGGQLGHDAAIAKAREIIAGTQFWYDELNLPMAIRRGGAAARVIFQFKPFMVNALRYEINMATEAAKGLAKGDLLPAAAAANHVALYGVYGGALGVLRHPVIAATLGAVGMLPFVPSLRELRARLADDLGEKSADSPHEEGGLSPTASTLLLHGLPGLVNTSLGSRLGITGQEIASLGTTSALGPHISTLVDFGKALSTFVQQEGSGKAIPIMAVGLLAPGFIPGSTGRVIANTPYARLAATWAAAYGPGGERWREFLKNSPEGRRFLSRFLPSVARSGNRAFELYQHGFYTDVRGRKIEVPYGEEGVEALTKAFGFSTTRDGERQAYLEWMRPKGFRYEASKNQFARDAAAAWIRGDRVRAWQLVLDAQEAGIFLDWPAIENQIERSNEEQVEAFHRQLPALLKRERP